MRMNANSEKLQMSPNGSPLIAMGVRQWNQTTLVNGHSFKVESYITRVPNSLLIVSSNRKYYCGKKVKCSKVFVKTVNKTFYKT